LLDPAGAIGYPMPVPRVRNPFEESVRNPARPTRSTRVEDVQRSWYVVDARDQVLGRLASQVAAVLRGKRKRTYTPHVDDGDFVIVVNASRVRLTGRKLERKVFYRHSGHPGSVRSVTAGRLLETRPERLIEGAVRGMLPHTPLGRRMLRKLKVYAGAEHPHEAQSPAPLELHG
jgi:large subunit ribosomal protein L13